MGNLVVRNVDDNVIRALKSQAGASGISAEALHRKILEQALLLPAKRSLSEALMTIPPVGEEADFTRIQEVKDSDVFT